MSRAAALCLCLVCACTPENGLWGSAGEVFDLEVSDVEVLRNDEALQVTYFHNRGTQVDVVARLGLALVDLSLAPGQKVDLAGEYAPGHQRLTVTHAPGGEASRRLPPVAKGDLKLLAGGAPGELTRGDFSLIFEGQGGDLAQGRTLYGTFRAEASSRPSADAANAQR